jgi:hypothetical protein
MTVSSCFLNYFLLGVVHVLGLIRFWRVNIGRGPCFLWVFAWLPLPECRGNFSDLYRFVLMIRLVIHTHVDCKVFLHSLHSSRIAVAETLMRTISQRSKAAFLH